MSHTRERVARLKGEVMTSKQQRRNTIGERFLLRVLVESKEEIRMRCTTDSMPKNKL